MPLPPPMFSIDDVWPSAAVTRFPSSRASVSVALPAANGTTNLMLGSDSDPALTMASARTIPAVMAAPSVHDHVLLIKILFTRLYVHARAALRICNGISSSKKRQRLAVAVETEA